MPDREFIHTTSDVTATLLFAFDSGLQVMVDEPQTEPRPRNLTRDDVPRIEKGSFHLYQSAWIFGPFQTMEIPVGFNRGKYFVQPRVNYSPISVFFAGERDHQGRRRLGSGVLSYHRDWLELPARIVWPTPPDVRAVYKSVASHMLSGNVVSAGVHRYHICRGVDADARSGQCLPPFDFIPWGREMTERRNG